MLVIDGICYADTMEMPFGIKDLKTEDSQFLQLTFSNGEKKLFDVMSLMDKGPVFEPLKEMNNRRTVELRYGTVTWMDGEIDVAPEALYEWSLPFEKPDRVAEKVPSYS